MTIDKVKSRNIVILILLIALIIAVVTCNKKKEKIVSSIPTKEYIEVVKTDSAALKKYRDSVQPIINDLEENVSNTKLELNASQALIETLLVELDGSSVSDTTSKSLRSQIAKIQKENKRKDSLCNTTISLLEEENELYKDVINKQDTFASNLNRLFNIVSSDNLRQQAELAKATKKRNQVYAGITAMGNKHQWVDGFGINLGIKLKNGTMIEPGVLQIGSVTSYTIGLKKIISFAK